MLTLYTIGTFMDRNGYAYPGQDKIAAGARSSKRTTQRHIAIAETGPWIEVVFAGRGGQGWRHHGYRACVPDHLVLTWLDDVPEDIPDAQRGDTMMAPPQDKAGDIIVSPASDDTAQRGDKDITNVATPSAEGDDKSTQTWRHSYGVLTHASEHSFENIASEEVQPSQRRNVLPKEERPECKPMPAERRRLIAEDMPSDPEQEQREARSRIDKAKKFIKVDPEASDRVLHSMYKLTADQIREVRQATASSERATA